MMVDNQAPPMLSPGVFIHVRAEGWAAERWWHWPDQVGLSLVRPTPLVRYGTVSYAGAAPAPRVPLLALP
jgi:hypothetical protein